MKVNGGGKGQRKKSKKWNGRGQPKELKGEDIFRNGIIWKKKQNISVQRKYRLGGKWM